MDFHLLSYLILKPAYAGFFIWLYIMVLQKSPQRSDHHVTPLSNILLGNEKCNILNMEHPEHVNLHKICDTRMGYHNKMDALYAYNNNDILLSLKSVDEIYKHLGYFFSSFEKLPLEVRKEIGEKWKQIITHHLNQRPQATNTDGDAYRKLRRSQIDQWWEIVTYNDIEYIMSQDKAILQDIVLHLMRRLKKYWILDKDLVWADSEFFNKNHFSKNYMIPLMFHGRADKTNYFSSQWKEHRSIINKAISEKWNSIRSARAKTNGKYILDSEDHKKRYDLQHKYLIRVERIVENDYGETIWKQYSYKIQQQLVSSIRKWNTLQDILKEDDLYTQQYHDFHSMHEESTLIYGKIGDKLKKILLEERVFV